MYTSGNNVNNDAYIWVLYCYRYCKGKKITCSNIAVKCKIRRVASHKHYLPLALNGETMAREIWKGYRSETNNQTQTRWL
jgi:hypothetical protein